MAIDLGDALEKSDIYKKYLTAKENLKADETLYNRVKEYRKNNFFIHNCEDGDRIEKMKKIYGDNYDMLIDSKVKAYMEAELILCRTIQNINNHIVEKIDLDIDFLE